MIGPSSPESYKIVAHFHRMVSTSKMLRLMTMFGGVWAMCTWVFVAYPFHDAVFASYRSNISSEDVDFRQPAAVAAVSVSSTSKSSTTTTNKSVSQQGQQPIQAQPQPKQKQVLRAQPQQRHATAMAQNETFSACLLIMDDNHFLIEWLAYHYHALPLRRLIVGIDPRSETSPSEVLNRWGDKMEITEWHDEDYIADSERSEAEKIVKMHFGKNLTAAMVSHRARQRIFYYKCMKQLKEEDRHWTLLTDTDEFLRINVKAAKSILQPVLQETNKKLPTAKEPASIRTLLQTELQRQGTNLTKSPCIQIPRLRFGAMESGKPPMTMIPKGYDATDFLTLRWRKHAGPDQYWANKISKVMIDLSQVPWSEIRPVESIHRPIKSICTQRKLHTRAYESVLVLNHYLGSWEQYEYRNDARVTDPRFGELRSRQQYNKQKKVDAGTANDDIRYWLKGFVESMGNSEAEDLLDGVGMLQSKGLENNNNADENLFLPQLSGENERCAIMLFGLPRSFKDLVLPSFEKNVIGPNARYNCDYFVHYYYRTEEPEGRANKGGKLDPSEILLLRPAVRQIAFNTHRKVHNHTPLVEFHSDTEDNFWRARNNTIQKYRNAKRKDGNYLYFPYNALTYHYPSSLDNIVRQWHSINGAWELMERSAKKRGIHYSRVAMFRSDVLYVTKTDIYETERNVYDSQNNQAVLAPFGAMPVNDRMFYGPYEAVEVWATRRFDFLEKYVHKCEPGWAMHSEKFLNGAVMPAIRELGIAIVVNPDICFLRTRADHSAVITDCHLLGETRGIKQKEMRRRVEQVVARKCSNPYMVTTSHIAVRCPRQQR